MLLSENTITEGIVEKYDQPTLFHELALESPSVEGRCCNSNTTFTCGNGKPCKDICGVNTAGELFHYLVNKY